jgi:SAM-dependent methyltransferase
LSSTTPTAITPRGIISILGVQCRREKARSRDESPHTRQREEPNADPSHRRLATAPVPITLTQAPVEALPFSDALFDSVVATLVFSSVADPARGFHEIKRVLKPGGTLLLLEHVRADARIQDALVPLTTRLSSNCHWNRDTERTVRDTGFQITRLRQLGGGLQPIIVLQAIRP